MAWSTPYTWTVGEILTAAKLQTYVSDNLTYLKSQTDLIYVTVYNNDAATINAGDPVVLDPSYTAGLGVKMPTSLLDMRAFGVVISTSISSHASGIVAIGGTIQNINVTGTVVFGHSLVSSASAHYAQDSGGGGWAPGVFGFALANQASGTGTIACLVKPWPLFYVAAQSYIRNATKTNTGTGTPATVIDSIVSDGTYRFLFLNVWNAAGAISTATFHSVGLTSLQDGTAAHPYVGYVLADAATAAVYANVASSNAGAICIILNGINQSTPVGTLATGGATSASVSVVVSCSPGDYLLAGFGAGNVTVSGGRASGQYNLADIINVVNGRMVVDYAIAIASTFTFTWTLSGSIAWSSFGVAVKSA